MGSYMVTAGTGNAMDMSKALLKKAPHALSGGQAW
jgi:hypothetical protein